MSFAYLASPYSAASRDQEHSRYQAALSATAWLLRQKVWVYSPIVHCHNITLEHNFPGDAQFWAGYNYAMLAEAEELLVLRISGWENSKGVKEEISWSRELLLPNRFVYLSGNEWALSDKFAVTDFLARGALR